MPNPPTVLSYTNAFPGVAPTSQHKSGQTIVRDYLYPGAVQPQKRSPDNGVLKITNALPSVPLPQHKSGQTSVTSYFYSGALQPIVAPIPFSPQFTTPGFAWAEY